MDAAIKCDWQEFDKAMVEYTAASGKTFADVQNAKMGDVALRAAQFADKANKSAIDNVYKTSGLIWAKFIQKVISQGFKLHGRRKATTEESKVAYVDLSTGKMKYGRKTVGVDRRATGAYADAVRVSKAIIRRRKNTVGMFRVIFSLVAMKFGKLAGRVERKGRNWLTVKYATPGNLMASFEIPFTNNKSQFKGGKAPSPSADVATKVRLGYRFLQRGIDFVQRDMEAYTERKMQQDANRVSAR